MRLLNLVEKQRSGALGTVVVAAARNRCDGLPGERWPARACPQMAAHESPRTTKLYDRTKDEITIGEVERIQL
jgi:hypothetical protein